MITIYINNKEIKTEAGKTILSVAKENGINIPTLCHDKNLSPYGSCWVCSVEIEGRRNLATSCGTTVSHKYKPRNKFKKNGTGFDSF